MVMKNFLLSILGIILTCCSSCGKKSDNSVTPDPVDTSKVEVVGAKMYVTKADKSQLFKETTVAYGSTSSMSPYAVRFTSDTYQTVEGFGAAITPSTCYNLLKMGKADRTAFLKNIFDSKDGLGSSLIRVCIGGSDFSIERYTWCDTEGIENFGVPTIDSQYLIPILKEIYAINPDVQIIGSPWSAPRWMKRNVNDSGNHYEWTGGTLKESCYQDYATYFVKWIQYMQSQGFKIYAVTPQNEPLNGGNCMSTVFYWTTERDFIKQALGPAFQKAGLKTKILVFDHNYNYDDQSSQKNYPLNIYADAEASKYIAGSAWHNYGGSVSELDNIVAKAPDKEIYFTEASIGTWNYSFDGCLLNDFRDLFLGTLSRNGKGVTLWNLVLDDKKGPYTEAPGSCSTCYGAVTIASANYTSLDYYSQYYDIAHCSKVIRPGAVRIGTKGYEVSGITYQAYKNVDGSYGVVILNENDASQQFVFISTKHSVKCNVPAKSIVSLKWTD